jgi:hypothetical protein
MEFQNFPNGRINLNGPPSAGGPGTALADPGVGDGRNAGGFSGFSYQKTAEVDFQADMLRGNWEKNPVSDAFFSQRNVQMIQNLIRRDVYQKSQPKGYIIDDQSVDELKIIMRALYLQYSKNLPHDITGQVADLNQRVADWSVPHILSAVDHYQYYLKDIQSLPVPLARSVHMSRAGTKTKPQDPFM